MAASVANPPYATVHGIISNESHERLTICLPLLKNAIRRLHHQRESAVADEERTTNSAEDKLADELGVLVSFLDPQLKAKREAKISDPLAPWSARKALLFFLFATSVSWLVVLGVIYLLVIII